MKDKLAEGSLSHAEFQEENSRLRQQVETLEREQLKVREVWSSQEMLERCQAAEARLATLTEVRDEQWDEIKGALKRNNIPIEGGVAATVNLLTDRFRAAEAQVSKLESAVAALREGLRHIRFWMQEPDTDHAAVEIRAQLNQLIHDPNPGARVEAELLSLRHVTAELLEAQREGGSLDGCDIQELLVKHGILEPFTATEPCCENGCVCAEVSEFPLECYRRTEIGDRVVRALDKREESEKAARDISTEIDQDPEGAWGPKGF